ncbi:MAG: winged helix DNA-binding domain-containing protein, partial [Gaiellaceae bacterium]
MRVLTQRELNRATLARQLLLERKKVGVVAALERVAGLQAQYAPSPFVGLWTRTDGFRRETLERSLLAHRVVRAVLMRGTIHLVSRADYFTFLEAVGDPPWLGAWSPDLGERAVEAVGAFGRDPRTRAEIAAFVERPLEDREWYALRTRARLVHAPESGFWKERGRTRYLTMPHEPPDVEEARVTLVRRYLAAFGPATRADIAEWSGLRMRDLEPALANLRPRFRDERGRDLYDVPRAPLPPADAPAPVRFLPRFDNLLLAHKDRTRVIADDHRGLVIEGGWIKSTFLVDGFVAGVWEVESGRVLLEPFAP